MLIIELKNAANIENLLGGLKTRVDVTGQNQ